MELKGSHVMITGANRGIGRAFAKECAEDGAHLYLVLRKKDAALVKELETAGAASVTQFQADLSEASSIAKFLKSSEELKIDILFNNAGILKAELFENQTTEEIYDVVQINLTALMHLSQGFLPGMLKRRRGKIINNSSFMGAMYLPFSSTYAAAKAGISAFTSVLRTELRGTGVSTLLLITPPVKTRMFEEFEKRNRKNFEFQERAMNPQTYAKIIREAVLNDLETVEPQGLTGIGMRLAKYIPQVFDWEVRRRFSRKAKSL
jgi:hypothetical protein